MFSSPQFAVLSESQIQDLHLAALEVLRRTGIRFHHREALEMLSADGAFVHDGNLVRYPAGLVEEALASAPGRIVLCDRNGEPAVWLEGTKVWFGTGSDCLNILDPETGEHLRFTQADIVAGYRLCDALPNIHFVMSMGIPADVDAAVAYDLQMALMLEHTIKPIVFVTDDRASCQRAIVAIARKLLVAVWHILARGCPDRFADPERVARKLLKLANRLGPARHPPGQTAVQHVRHHLDRLGLGAELTSVPWGKTRRIHLPPSQVATEAN